MAAGLKSSCGWKMQRVLDLVAKSYFLTCESGNARLRHGLDSGPFVYRLGHQVFNLGRGVQLPYGLPSFQHTIGCDETSAAKSVSLATLGGLYKLLF